MIESRDVLLFISYSGSAKELDLILPQLKERSVTVLAMTGKSVAAGAGGRRSAGYFR
jgi:arabinose 5-phosphate isomerase